MGRPLALAAALAFLALPGLAQDTQPSSTSATYGNWTVTCAQVDAQKVCQMVSKLNLKDADGQVRPLIEVAIGQPPSGGDVRIVVQVPMDVALREPLVVSVDAEGADPAASPRPQQALLSASYFACVPAGCIADAVLDRAAVATLQKVATMTATFTALNGARKIGVPVALDGFADAWAALGVQMP
jgi:invasion protein IalB